MTTDQALLRLAASTEHAIRGVLDTFAPGALGGATVDVVAAGADPFATLALPAVLADVSYVDGVNGGNVLAIGIEGARRLAAVMMGQEMDSVESGGELSELDLSAVGEAMNQMMSAAAMATSEVLGEEVEIAPPQVRVAMADDPVSEREDHSGHACTVSLTLCGSQCLIVQLVPHAFIMRMTRAYDELTENYESAPLSASLRAVRVRVWAELGRVRMPSGRAVCLPGGSVVELDRDVDEPIDLYADGMRFATGRLLVTDDGGLAVRIEELLTTTGQPSDLVVAGDVQ